MGVPANISRDYYSKAANRQKLLFQQGKPVLDAELNYIQDIARENVRSLVEHSIGDGCLGDDFLVMSTGVDNQIKIKAGTFLYRGYEVYLPNDVTISGLTTPIGPRTDIIWVEFLDLDEDSIDDPDLKDIILGVETVHGLNRTINIYVAEGTSPTPISGNLNWFRIAKLNRVAGNASITSANIVDERIRTANNYVSHDLRITQETGLIYQWTAGMATVGNFDFYVLDTGPAIPASKAIKTFDLASTTGLPEDVSIESKVTGTLGNLINIQFVIPNSQYYPLSVSVTGGLNIVVSCATGSIAGVSVSTLNDVINAINLQAQSSQLVLASLISGASGSDYVTNAYGLTFLENGQDGLPGVRTIPKNASAYYVYVDVDGNVVNALNRPTEYHVMLAQLASNDTDITSNIDLRRFRPAANRGGLNNSSFGPGGQIPADTGTTDTDSNEKDFLIEENLSPFDVVTYGTIPDAVRLANASDDVRMPAIGMAVTTLAAGKRSTILLRGKVVNSLWTWIPNAPIYMNIVSGAMTQNDPTADNSCSQYLGFALEATSMWFDPNSQYIINHS